MKPLTEKIVIKQGQFKELVQVKGDLAIIELVNGSKIYMKARPQNYGYGSILDCRIEEREDEYEKTATKI